MSLNEFDIINRFFSDLTDSRADTITAIGDDCALLKPPPGKLLAVSTDTLVAGEHFFEDIAPEKIGHKSLAVNLSDLAAMGATPAWVSLALTLPEVNEAWLASFAKGFGKLAQHHNLELVGGDLTKGNLSITITIHGFVDPDSVMRRAGAALDDLVCVTGKLGAAALALKYIKASEPVADELLTALQMPEPRVAAGQAIAKIATACIDISDGLMADLGHICQASGCGAELDLAKLPVKEQVLKEINKTSCWDLALSGGDDYELCFTLNPQDLNELEKISQRFQLDLTVIGKITAAKGVVCLQNGQPVDITATGYMHFL